MLCCILAIFIENKLPSRKEVASLVLLSIGVMIAVWEGAINGSPHGIMLCVVGTVCNAAMMSTSGRLLSEKLDVLRLAFYTAPVSCIALFPFCYAREVRRTRHAHAAPIQVPISILQGFKLHLLYIWWPHRAVQRAAQYHSYCQAGPHEFLCCCSPTNLWSTPRGKTSKLWESYLLAASMPCATMLCTI